MNTDSTNGLGYPLDHVPTACPRGTHLRLIPERKLTRLALRLLYNSYSIDTGQLALISKPCLN